MTEERSKLERIYAQVARRFAPPPRLLTSECAELYRYLPTEVTTKPGRWSNDNAPYLVEPMDIEQIEPWIDTIYMMKASRTGGTEIFNNKHLRKQKFDPGPVLYVQQSDVEARKYSDVIFQAMTDNCPAFSELLTVDNTLFKKFMGGLMVIAGAQTPKAFRMLEFVWAWIDDLDGCPAYVGEEGDLMTLAETRTSNAMIGRLNGAISSPTLKGSSPIEALFNTSDKRRWHVPCPICDYGQVLKWGGVDFDFGVKWKNRDPSTAYYLCESCHKEIRHFQKWEMNLQGNWQKTATPATMNIAGFHFSQIFSNFVTWKSMVEAWLKVGKDPNKLRVFVNTRLGETFEDLTDQVSDNVLLQRCEEYGPLVPVGAYVLTAWADVQHDRIEVGVSGWGRDQEHWLLEYKVLTGNPVLPAVWDELHNYLTRPRVHENGMKLKIMAAGVDSGYLKDQVYNFVRPRKILNIVATKGANVMKKPIMAERSSKPIWKSDKVTLYEIGTDTAKQTIKSRMLVDQPGPVYMHFYLNAPPGCMPCDDYYFQGLTNAKLVNKSKNPAAPKMIWEKKRKGDPDEQIDIQVGNLAMLNWLMQNKDFNLNHICERTERTARARVAAEQAGLAPKKKGRIRSKGISIDKIMGRE